MAKIIGFSGKYIGLKENDAWQKIYEFGKNLMPIKERILQRKYNKIFNKNTKVVREDELKKITTDKLVPGDIIIIEKGDFVPVDGKVLEEVSLEFDKVFKPEDKSFLDDSGDKVIYQGMRVKKGKAVIEAIRTGESTYLGSFVKQIDNKVVCESNLDKIIRKYFTIIGGLGLIFLLFGSIFAFINSESSLIERLSISAYSGLLLFLSTLPVGAIMVFSLKLIDQKSILRKSNLIIRKNNAILKAHKSTVICLDERFLSRNYEKYIQRFYSAGIMIAVISNKREDEIKEIAKKAGIFDGDVNSISGLELENMEEDKFYKEICNTVIFYEVNRNQKRKIIEGFNKLKIKTISIVDDIEDLPTLKYTDIGICTHEKKKNLEYEFSNAIIIGTELTSIYSLIKGSCIVKNYLNHYIKYYVMFQIPVILSLLTALLAGIDLKVFYFQTLMFIMVIIPLLLLMVNRDYTEDKILELKDRDKIFAIDCVKFSFVGIFVGILGIGLYILLGSLNLISVLRIGFITVLFTIIDSAIIIMSRKKFKVVKSKDSIKEEKKEVKEEKVENKIKKVKEPIKSKKILKKNKKSDIRDIENEIM